MILYLMRKKSSPFIWLELSQSKFKKEIVALFGEKCVIQVLHQKKVRVKIGCCYNLFYTGLSSPLPTLFSVRYLGTFSEGKYGRFFLGKKNFRLYILAEVPAEKAGNNPALIGRGIKPIKKGKFIPVKIRIIQGKIP